MKAKLDAVRTMCLVALLGALTAPALAQPADPTVTQVAAGQGFTCALTTAGSVKCWGTNFLGQLGDGTTTQRLQPVGVTGLGSGVVSIAAGGYHACALTMSGGVKCWGYNAHGELGDGTTTQRLVPVNVIGLSSGVAAIGAGNYHTCALTSDGGVRCWGYNEFGELGDNTGQDRSIPVAVSGLPGISVDLSVGSDHGCVVGSDGVVRCWGANYNGQLGDGSTNNSPLAVAGPAGVRRVAAGGGHTCAVTVAGAAKCWGFAWYGQLGDGLLAYNQLNPVDVLGLGAGVLEITAGGAHTCALVQDGGIQCWGYNAYGQLGDGTMTNRATPTSVSGLTSGVAGLTTSGSMSHTCALTTNGGLKCWGYNGSGQTGSGPTPQTQTTPVAVFGFTGGVPGQSIVFDAPASLALGVSTTLTATASSGLPVVFDTWTPSTCSVTGSTVVATGYGLCGIRASQAGDASNSPAPQALRLVLVPPVAPDAPTIGVAVPGDGLAFVAFAPPSSDGGSPITGYTATCGAQNASGPSSPVVVRGLSNGSPVTCSVIATNAIGNSSASGESNSVTPEVGASFDLTVALTSLDSGGGVVQSDANGSCALTPGGAASCTYAYPTGAVAHLVALPASDSVLEGWTGACAQSGATPTCDVPINAAATIGAAFRGPQTLTIQAVSLENGVGQLFANSQGGVNLQCEGAAGTTVTCTAQVKVGDTVYFGGFPGNLSVLDSIVGCTADPLNPDGSGCYPGVVMTGPKAMSATFRGPQTLTIQAVSLENGVGQLFANSQGGMNLQCEGAAGTTVTCTAQVKVGDTVYFGAFPGNLSVLDSIVGCTADPLNPDGSGCYPGVVMTGPKAMSATFRGPQTLTIQAVSLENGVGQLFANSQGGMNLQCEGAAGTTVTCTAQVKVGDTVYFGAFPGNLSVLASIAGCLADPLNPDGSGCYPGVVMTGPKAMSATFRGPQTLTIQAVSLENGVGQLFANNQGGMNLQCEGVAGTTVTCTAQVRVGDTVYFGAFPGNLSVLASIAGCTADPLNPDGSGCYPGVVITGPRAMAATFRGPQALSVVFGGNGSGVVSLGPVGSCASGAGTCSHLLRVGTVQELVASASPDSLFQSWTGACAGQGATCSLTVTAPVATQAVFVLRNQPPIAVAGGPYSGVRNQAVTFTGGGSSDPDNDSLAYTWDFGDGSAAGSGIAPTHSYAATGTFTITLTVNDGTVNSAPVTSTVTIANQTPTANAGGPYSGVRNTGITFSGAASSDSDSDTLTYSWDFGDGGTGTGVAPTHAYAATGTFTVTLTVNDGTLNSAPATSSVAISNQGPIANAGGPYSGVRNTAVAFSGAASHDPDNDSLTYSWDFGDGEAGTGVSPTHAYATTGAFTVTLTASDGTSNSAPATATVTISNQTPTAYPGGPYSGVRNGAITFNGGASTDPDNDGLSYSWDFGDGGTGSGAAPTHAYAATGTFTVTLTVNDGTVNSAPATSTVAISNQAPIANAGGPYSGVRNTPITFSGAGSHDSDNDPLTYSWDFGDGSAAGSAVAPTHAYATTGTFTVTLTVNDGTTNSTPATSTVTIANRAPIANPGGPYAGTRLAAISFNGSASSDPDGDALTYSWAFGDGGTGTGATPTHLYTAVGAFTVTLIVNDGTTNSAPVTSTVQITNVTPTVALTAPSGGAVFNAPANVVVSASAADSDGSVAKVEFFAGGGKIGEALGAPYSITWPAAVPGVYTLTAIVTDSSGATATSAPVSVLLNAPPMVSLSAPANGAQFAAPASITLTASASDTDGTIAQVQFFRGTTSLGVDTTSPYSVTWSGATVGSYTLTAVATDNRGAVVTSTPITVKVTATLTPTADSYVRAQNGNSNFGMDTTVAVQQGTSNGSRKWTYMKFDLSSVPTITNAKVRVFGAVSATTSTVIQTAAYSVSNTTWTETGITWNNKPASGTTALATATIVNNSTTARWYELDVTAYLQAEKAAGRNVVTLAFKNLANSTPFVSFTSKEGTAANRPQVLVVP